MCGTPEYLAPEIVDRKGHGRAVDWYSIGALTYEMLTGLPPYYTRDREKLFQRIRQGQLPYPSYLSPVARDFLQGLLNRDPEKRLGGGQADGEEVKARRRRMREMPRDSGGLGGSFPAIVGWCWSPASWPRIVEVHLSPSSIAT